MVDRTLLVWSKYGWKYGWKNLLPGYPQSEWKAMHGERRKKREKSVCEQWPAAFVNCLLQNRWPVISFLLVWGREMLYERMLGWQSVTIMLQVTGNLSHCLPRHNMGGISFTQLAKGEGVGKYSARLSPVTCHLSPVMQKLKLLTVQSAGGDQTVTVYTPGRILFCHK